MSLVDVPPGIIFPYLMNTGALTASLYNTEMATLTTLQTLDATGEKCLMAGYLYVPNGGTGMTLNKITWNAGAVTAGTSNTMRLGVQGVNTSAGPSINSDGTWGRYKDFAQFAGISGAAWNTTTLDSGTTTYSNGALIAVVWDLTARTDGSLVVRGIYRALAGTAGYPCCNTHNGTAWAATSTAVDPIVILEFDDGGTTRYGTLRGGFIASAAASSTFNSGSATDEFGLLFQSPFEFTANSFWAPLAIAAAAGIIEMRLFSAPLSGSPTQLAIATLTGYEAAAASTTTLARTVLPFAGSAVTIAKNTDYLISCRPTTSTNVAFGQTLLNNAAFRELLQGGTTLAKYSRTDNAGAFASSSTTDLPLFGLGVSQLHDGAASGGLAIPVSGRICA